MILMRKWSNNQCFFSLFFILLSLLRSPRRSWDACFCTSKIQFSLARSACVKQPSHSPYYLKVQRLLLRCAPHVNSDRFPWTQWTTFSIFETLALLPPTPSQAQVEGHALATQILCSLLRSTEGEREGICGCVRKPEWEPEKFTGGHTIMHAANIFSNIHSATSRIAKVCNTRRRGQFGIGDMDSVSNQRFPIRQHLHAIDS